LAEVPVLVERPGEGIAKLTLNNPPLNLVTLEMTEQLSDHPFGTEDCAERILAFFEKREPRFAGAPGTGDEVEV
jgi:hypothetical protein